MDYQIRFPEGFEEYAWQLESKGWCGGIEVLYDKKIYSLTYYDPHRFAQDVADELAQNGFFFGQQLGVY